MTENPDHATLLERLQIAPGLQILRLAPRGGEVPSFEPGQFVHVGLTVPMPARSARSAGPPASVGTRPRLVRRAYSIASSPKERRYLELCVVRVPGGLLTQALWELEVGGRLWVDSRARGAFTLERAASDADVVFVATGTGVAPFMSMLRTYRSGERWRRAVLVHGVRHSKELVYRGELEEIARTDPQFTYVPVVSREPDWTGLRGRVQVVLDDSTWRKVCRAPLDPACTHLFLCGHPGMIRDVGTSMTSRGFRLDHPGAPGNLHYERYW